jgi:hypothetical protein
MSSEIHIMKNQQMVAPLIYLKLHGNVKSNYVSLKVGKGCANWSNKLLLLFYSLL